MSVPGPPSPLRDRGTKPTPEPDQLVLQPRDVAFDWSGLPLRWIPGEPVASHVINVLHLLLPEGERWFVETLKQVLPMIRDEACPDGGLVLGLEI